MAEGQGDVVDKLTPRQREILAMKAKGLTDREVASHLGIKYTTVKSYARNARERTGKTTFELAVAVAISEIMS